MRIEKPKYAIEVLGVNSPCVVAAEDVADVEVAESSRQQPLRQHPLKRSRRS